MQLETDDFLIAVRTLLIAAVAELVAGNVVVWHHGAGDPDEEISAAVAKCGGVSALIYDLGGTEESPEADVIRADAAVELYVDTTKRNRRKNPALRLGGTIRDEIMRTLHRAAALRNQAAFFDCRVRAYLPLEDPEFTAWRITLSRSIYLES